jgi:hypothetical protein
MELKTYFAQDQFGNIIPNATVTIYLTGTSTLATGLEDVSGAPLTNPFTADGNAKIAVQAPNGIYDIVTESSTYTAPRMTVQFLDGQTVIDDAAEIAAAVITTNNNVILTNNYATAAGTSATNAATSATGAAGSESSSSTILTECQDILTAIQSASITDKVFYLNPPSDPDGTIAGLAGTSVGEGFFVVQGANVSPAFKFYQHMSDGTAMLYATLPGQSAINNNVNAAATFASIPVGAVGFWLVANDETKNIGPTFYYINASGTRYWFAMVRDN